MLKNRNHIVVGMVMVKCRKCGRNSDAEGFVLDSVDKMMICGQCVKDKKVKKVVQRISFLQEPRIGKEKPFDIKKEIKEQIVEPLDDAVSVIKLDAERVKYKCPKCGFGFIYNIVTGRPKNCGYCAETVGKIDIKEEGIYDF